MKGGHMERRTVREWRLANGLTQTKLAHLVGVSHISVGNWEKGRFEPTPRKLQALAAALGVSMDQIAFRKEEAEAALQAPART